MKNLLTCLAFVLFSLFGCMNEPQNPLVEKTKYYLLDFSKIASMVGTDYDSNAQLLKDYKVVESTSIGVRTGEYFLIDNDSILMEMTIKENSNKKINEINLTTSLSKIFRTPNN
ncbi:MAG: hypothetical protein QM800_04160 [Paludibacter sp.]